MGNTVRGGGRFGHTERNSRSHAKPLKKGAVALDLNEDMKTFKTW